MSSLQDYLESRKRLKIYHNELLDKNEPFSPRGEICCLGYDSAKEMGILEIYKDAWGPNFNRDVDWDAKYPHLVDYHV